MSKYYFAAIFILLFSISMPAGTAIAADKANTSDNLEIYELNDAPPWYNPNAAEIQCTADTSTADIPGDGNMVKIYNYFLAKGTSKQTAAAITGSIWQESKGNPTLIQGGGNTTDPSTVGRYKDGSLFENKEGQVSVGKAWGIIQWDPGNAALYWQKQSGISGDISKLETQLEVTWWHLNNRAPTSRSNVLAEIEAAPSLDTAVETMSLRFFACGKCMNENRIKAAKKALGYEVDPAVAAALVAKQDEQVVMSQYCVNEQDDTLGDPDAAVISPNASGYSKPIDYTFEDRLKKCTVQTCHPHDKTAAFDLIVKPGTPVYAIYDGEVYSNKRYTVGTASSDSSCRSVQFKGNDGWIYWYGHTYITAAAGKKFKSGELMGYIGSKNCGLGGTAHLHIDRGSPRGRVGGEDAHRDAGFIKLLQDIYAGK